MNEKLKRTRLNDAFKRFQRLPMLLPKGDMRDAKGEKPTWQPMPFGLMSKPTPALQGFAE
jgi:hypothetical protein